MASKNNNGTYLGINYESLEELQVLWFFEELMNAGIVRSVERCNSYPLYEGKKLPYIQTKELKKTTKIIDKEYTLLREHIYTPEFLVVWNQTPGLKFLTEITLYSLPKKPDTVFFFNHYKDGYPVTYVEVKPDFQMHNMTREFTINQKWMYSKYKIYINLVKPKELFTSTFAPELFKFTPTKLEKKIYPYRSLNQFLNDNTN